VLFARYAFQPNLLGYCGPEDHLALFEYTINSHVDAGLLELEQRFEGAIPYLQLIAHANGIADPLDTRVVEAYWVGNELLDQVDLRRLYANVEDRFRRRTSPNDWSWLARTLGSGAFPHHSFHVFAIYPRAGLMRSGAVEHIFETMEQCRIRWGRVIHINGSELEVTVQPLELDQGKLRLGTARRETVRRWVDGRGFVDDVRLGDWVSIHWRWACDRLTPHQRSHLERFTRLHLDLCNQAL
jgi:hypothetical protein